MAAIDHACHAARTQPDRRGPSATPPPATENVLQVDTGFDRRQPEERPPQRPGADEQHHGECDFGHEKPLAAGSSRRERRPARNAIGLLRRRPQVRRQPEQKSAGQRCRDGEREHAPVELTDPARGSLPGQSRRKAARRSPRARRPTSAREPEQRSRQVLTHEPAPAGAERGAHRDLTLLRDGAREHQAPDVRTRDEQHEADRAEQQPQRRLHAADVRPQRLGDEPRPAIRIGYCSARCRPTRSSSACAAARVAPDRRRAHTLIPGACCECA